MGGISNLKSIDFLNKKEHSIGATSLMKHIGKINSPSQAVDFGSGKQIGNNSPETKFAHKPDTTYRIKPTARGLMLITKTN